MNDNENWIWNDILSSQRLIIAEATSRLLNYISIVLSITLIVLDIFLIRNNDGLSILDFILAITAIGFTCFNIGTTLERKHHQIFFVDGSYSNVITLGWALKFNKLKCVDHIVKDNYNLYSFTGKNGKFATYVITNI
ncbi:hypothetical protein [Lactobacillus crispatus]|uniref:hypothetical protein n=1 Tax=Lactobacillus crispatus TaxID=47770 RepID=UPI0010618296|nr:hypothetical protein [Lactobacillus crispatus]TDM95017.1 hypothetical protein CEE88_13430 [Lactobacillus crispatus]